MDKATITIQATSEIEPTTAKANGTITDIGDANPNKRGFVYDLSSQSDPGDVAPNISGYDNVAEEKGNFRADSFDIDLSSLLKNTQYYIRAFAHNKYGYSYSSETDFTTWSNIFPDSIYSPRAKNNKACCNYDIDKDTTLFAPDISKLDDEVVAIETELGTNVKGIYADLKARLEWIESQLP
jgi:hypothetical protein